MSTGFSERQGLYREVEALRGRPLIVVASSRRTGARGLLGDDYEPELLCQLELLPPCAEIDLLITSGGGFAGVAENLSSLIGEYVDFHALVAGPAMSAATELCCAAQTITMTHAGALGPTDANCDGLNEEALRCVRGLWDSQRIPAEHRAQLLVKLVGERDLNELATLARAEKGGEDWLVRTLSKKMRRGKAKRIAHALTHGRSSHETRIYRHEAQALGLPVKFADAALEPLLQKIVDDLARDFQEGESYLPLAATFDEPGACRVGSPRIPVSKPVPQVHKMGAVESARLARAQVQDYMIFVTQKDGVPEAKPTLLRSRWQDAESSAGKQPTGECHV